MTAGALFVIVALAAGLGIGVISAGFDRILTARLQSRVGPPLLQPVYDVVKLALKEPLIVNAWQAFCACTTLAAAILAWVLFFLQSDLLLVFFVQAVGAVFLVVGALAAASPYSHIGAHRELLQMLAYEPLLILVFIGMYLETGSFRLEALFAWPKPLLLRLPFLFLVLAFALIVKMRKSPFDLSSCHHAHQELVRGVLTDYSGPLLALAEVAHWFEVALILGLFTLFWPDGGVGRFLLPVAAWLGVIAVDNLTSRANWRWMLGCAWGLGLGLAIVNLVWIR
ncbi:MAG: complex I subunit 1 family protein [Desulfobacterales bacterium]